MNQVLSKLGTFVIVTIVTMLVWLYAEDANIEEYTKQTIRLQFEVPDGSTGRITPDGSVTVEVDFNGSNGQYQQFIERTRGQVINIDLPIDPDLDLHEMKIDVRTQLQRYVFRDMGMNVTAVSPEIVPVTFEKDIEFTIEIEIVEEPGPLRLSKKQFANEDERRITMSLPAGLAQQIGKRPAIVRVRQSDVKDVLEGGSKQLPLPVEWPAGIRGLPPLNTNVDVLVTVANDRGTVSIDRRPIILSVPPSVNERYLVSIDESGRFITAFELEGPRDQIEPLKQDPASPAVWATVRLTNAEADAAAAGGGELTKQVDIIAPPGVVLSSDVVRVTVRVTPRTTPAP